MQSYFQRGAVTSMISMLSKNLPFKLPEYFLHQFYQRVFSHHISTQNFINLSYHQRTSEYNIMKLSILRSYGIQMKELSQHSLYFNSASSIKIMELKDKARNETRISLHDLYGMAAGVALASFLDIEIQAESKKNEIKENKLKDEEEEFLENIKKNHHEAILGLYISPFLTLSLGYRPSLSFLKECESLIQPKLPDFSPWELSVIIWSIARMGYFPGENFSKDILEHIEKNIDKYTPDETAVIMWSLCIQGKMTDELWIKFSNHIGKTNIKDMDEPTLLHLVQAAMLFSSIDKESNELRASSSEMVRTLKSTKNRKLIDRCVAEYQEYVPFHPYLDGPYMVMIYMMKNISKFFEKEAKDHFSSCQILKDFAANENIMHISDTLHDSRELSRIKRELYFQWRGNQIVDSYQDVVNQVIFLCSRHIGEVIKMPQDCDVVLPVKKIVVFVEDDRSNEEVESIKGQTDKMWHLFGTETIEPTCGFFLHESPGTIIAKRRSIVRRGWKVCIVSMKEWEKLKTNEEKAKYLTNLFKQKGANDDMASLFRSAFTR